MHWFPSPNISIIQSFLHTPLGGLLVNDHLSSCLNPLHFLLYRLNTRWPVLKVIIGLQNTISSIKPKLWVLSHDLNIWARIFNPKTVLKNGVHWGIFKEFERGIFVTLFIGKSLVDTLLSKWLNKCHIISQFEISNRLFNNWDTHTKRTFTMHVDVLAQSISIFWMTYHPFHSSNNFADPHLIVLDDWNSCGSHLCTRVQMMFSARKAL